MTRESVCNVYKVCYGQPIITHNTHWTESIRSQVMRSLLILLVVLFVALSSTMTIYSPHHYIRIPGQFMQLQENVKRDRRMALYHHPHHNTRAVGQSTKNHLWAKRATGRCPSECCKPCHEKVRNCKKRSRGVRRCDKGKFCDNACSLFPIYSLWGWHAGTKLYLIIFKLSDTWLDIIHKVFYFGR